MQNKLMNYQQSTLTDTVHLIKPSLVSLIDQSKLLAFERLFSFCIDHEINGSLKTKTNVHLVSSFLFATFDDQLIQSTLLHCHSDFSENFRLKSWTLFSIQDILQSLFIETKPCEYSMSNNRWSIMFPSPKIHNEKLEHENRTLSKRRVHVFKKRMFIELINEAIYSE